MNIVASRRLSSVITTLVATKCRHTTTNALIGHPTRHVPSRRFVSSTSSLMAAADAAAILSLSPLVAEDGSSSLEKELKERFSGKRVALYFSAGWCPMCTSFEPALQQFRAAAEDSGKPVEIVYVPSDRSENDASSRAKNLGMAYVPFDRAGDYKKAFGVWAGSEAIQFGFGGRRSGVPALVVLNPNDGSELAFVAAESQGAKALTSWPLDEGVW